MEKNKSKWIYSIYMIALIYIALKTLYYYAEVDWGPDASAHMSYLVYEYENPDKLVPVFEEMHMLEFEVEGNVAKVVGTFSDVNYLGHPPLYYKLLALGGCVVEDDGILCLKMKRILKLNLFFVLLGLLFCMETGRRVIQRNGDQLLYHGLFATIIATLPMVSYLCGSPTNDNLLYLPVGLVLLGLERGVTGKRDYLTFILIALGTIIALLTKLTAALMIAVALVITVIYIMIKEKSVKLLWCKQFGVTLPVYLIPVAYFLALQFSYKVIQPTQQLLSPESAENSIWSTFVAEEKTVEESVDYFWTNFWDSWTTVYSEYMNLDKSESILKIVFWIFVGVFALWMLYSLGKLVIGKLELAKLPIFAYGIGAIVAFLVQFKGAVPAYMEGKLAGYQARYYVCAIAIFALGSILPLLALHRRLSDKKNLKLLLTVGVAIYMALLLYGDFGYFLTNFAAYRDVL